MRPYRFPDGRRFAFTIVDDTDVATVANVRPVYQLLSDLGLRTTKTVWPVACPEGSRNYHSSETLEDAPYRAFVQDLQARGFEIALHGATMESSPRARVLRAVEQFRSAFGRYPRIHINHGHNRDNLYWGTDRIDDRLLRLSYARLNGRPAGYYQGHVPDSEFWWGDLVERHVDYVRNLTFNEINLLRVNPTMPYHDPRRPLVKWWFSSADADGVEEFKKLLATEHQDQLEREGGVCIVATHFGKGYVRDGKVDEGVRVLLEELASRDGWFPATGELLDWMRGQNGGPALSSAEWRRMQWRWGRDVVSESVRRRLRPHAALAQRSVSGS